MGKPVIDNLSLKRCKDGDKHIEFRSICDANEVECRYCFYMGDTADCREVIATCIQLSPPSPPPNGVFVYSCRTGVQTVVKDRLGNDCGKSEAK